MAPYLEVACLVEKVLEPPNGSKICVLCVLKWCFNSEKAGRMMDDEKKTLGKDFSAVFGG